MLGGILFMRVFLPPWGMTRNKKDTSTNFCRDNPAHLFMFISVASAAEPRGEKILFFVQISGGEKL